MKPPEANRPCVLGLSLCTAKSGSGRLEKHGKEIDEKGASCFVEFDEPYAMARFGPTQHITQHAAVPAQIPFPGCEALTVAAERYAAALPGADYYGDSIRAHRAAGLMHEHALGDKRCATFGTGQHQKAKKHL